MSRDFGLRATGTIVNFGNFKLDLDSQTLSAGEGSARLRSKLCLVLEYLVANKNRLIPREELISQIWEGNSYTGKQAVTHSICHLRKLLSSLGDGSTRIDTIPKRGYRLLVIQHQTEEEYEDSSSDSSQANTQFSYKSPSPEYSLFELPQQKFTIDFN